MKKYNYTSLNRFIGGKTKTMSRDIASILWTYVCSAHPRHILPGYDGDGRFFYAACEFFEVGLDTQKHLAYCLVGEYELFHVSQLFDNERNVLVASLSIAVCSQETLITVKERQEYDGRLGGCPEKDEFTGYAFERSGDIYCFTKGTPQHTPKIYIFDRRHENPSSGQIDWIEGVMTKGAGSNRAAFHSPAYARRTDSVQPRIITLEEMKEVDLRIAKKLFNDI